MTKYLIQANYVGEGAKGLLKEGGSSRQAAVEKLFASQGGSVESFYYAFGDTDLFVIAEMPDHASMAAIALLIGASGAITLKTTVLLPPTEIDEAAKKTPVYRAPGQ
ncbi:MAG: GYD domain-containing protein [Caldilineaceae bacterium]|nr:GYD domain-containing protein [Caldilineaceae bacterium]MCB0125781.1 GYD domain-containing protein [Caldilineaceae bacterium]